MLWHLYPSYLLVTLVSLIAITWYASNAMERFFIKQVAADLEARAMFLNQLFDACFSPLNPNTLDRLSKEIGKASHTRITIMSPKGVVWGDSEENPEKMDNHGNRPEVFSAIQGNVGYEIRYSATLGQKMMYVAVPVEQDGQIQAVLRTAVPVTSIDEAYKTFHARMAWGGLLIAFLAAAVCLLVSRRISFPIEKMKEGALRFAKGDFSLRLSLPKSEEMSSLAEALNRMASQLDDRIKAVSRHRNELEAVLSSMVEGVIAIDPQEKIISINQAAAAMFDRDPWEIHGRSIQEVIRNPELQRFVKKALSNGQSASCDITFYQNEERILRTHSSPLLDIKEERIGILIVMEDVTKLRRLENIRRDFVSNVSHEIKTPITLIKGFVETLIQDSDDCPDQARRFLGIIDKHVNRLEAIIEDLLKLSRIERESERMEIVLEKGSITEVIQTAIDLCQPKAIEKGIQIGFDCQQDLTVRMDPPLMEQAVVNLLDNAIKYSHPEGKIWIEVLPSGSNIEIRVKDQGIGIPKEHLPRLFERFYRVDKARSRQLGGTGLGLAIVKHIVQAHKGTVGVVSAPGEGTTFTLHLPRAD